MPPLLFRAADSGAAAYCTRITNLKVKEYKP